MAYRTINNLDPKLHKASQKLLYFQRHRVYQLRKLYPSTVCPLLHSLKPLEMLGSSYTEGIQKICKGAHALLEEHGTKWVLVSKAFKLRDNQDKTHAYKLAHIQNIRIQFKTTSRLSVQNSVVNTRVLKYLLALRGARLLLSMPESAVSLQILSKTIREALKLPHFAHIETSLILGLRLMGYRVLKRQYGSMVIGCKLNLKEPEKPVE